MTEQKVYTTEDGQIARDHLGHTICPNCLHSVSEEVEKFSLSRFGRILCFTCQKKYITTHGTTKTD